MVLAKRAAAPPGSTLVVEVDGSAAGRLRDLRHRSGRAAARAPGRPDRAARDGPRVVRRAGRRSSYAGGRCPWCVTRRRRPGRADPRAGWRSRRELVARRHPLADRPDRAGDRCQRRRSGPLHRARARPGGGPRRAGRPQPRQARGDRGVDPRGRARTPSLERLVVDLADLSSVRAAATEAAAYGSLDLLVNNAGIMATPYRRTVDGFESQLATNHFGPFLLTGLLLPAAGGRRAGSSRCRARCTASRTGLRSVTRTSKPGPICAGSPTRQTKLANLLFTFELDRRLRETGSLGDGAGRPPRVRRHAPGRERTLRPLHAAASPRFLDKANAAVGQTPGRRSVADPDGRDRRPARARRTAGPPGLGEAAGHRSWSGGADRPAIATRSVSSGSSPRRRPGSRYP